jgi:hypothetical protein
MPYLELPVKKLLYRVDYVNVIRVFLIIFRWAVRGYMRIRPSNTFSPKLRLFILAHL